MKCNKCGAELKLGAKFCTSCGNKNIVQNSFSGGGKTCPNCGKEIKDNKKFCTSCGMKLPEPKSSSMTDLKIDDNIDINMLYKRAFMYLEDGYKDKALAYFEHFLDRNPEDPTAFYGKLMLDLSFESEDDFKKLDKDIRENKNFKRAYRYGDETLKKKLDEYVHISFGNMLKAARNLDQLERTKEQLIQNGAENIENDFESCRNKILDEMYNDAVARRKRADSPDGMRFAYNSFVEVGDYRDAAKQAEECLETEKQMIKDAETDKIYQDAVKIKDDAASGVLPDYEFESSLKKAIATFEQLGEYKDSQKYLNVCNRILSSYKKPVTDAQTEINESSTADNLAKKPKSILEQIKDLFLKKKIIIISAAVLLVIILAVIIILVTRPSETKSNNLNNFSTAETETVPKEEITSDTTSVVTSPPEESDDDIKAVKYAAANNFILSEQYEDALKIFNELGSYKDSADKAKECEEAIERIKKEKEKYELSDVPLKYLGKTFDDIINALGEPDDIVPSPTPEESYIAYKYGRFYVYSSVPYNKFSIADIDTENEIISMIAAENGAVIDDSSDMEIYGYNIIKYADDYKQSPGGIGSAGFESQGNGEITLNNMSLSFRCLSGNNGKIEGTTLYIFELCKDKAENSMDFCAETDDIYIGGDILGLTNDDTYKLTFMHGKLYDSLGNEYYLNEQNYQTWVCNRGENEGNSYNWDINTCSKNGYSDVFDSFVIYDMPDINGSYTFELYVQAYDYETGQSTVLENLTFTIS